MKCANVEYINSLSRACARSSKESTVYKKNLEKYV